MSLYEVLALAALVGAGGFAWHLYRKDMRSPRSLGAQPDAETGGLMFRRPSADRPRDGAGSRRDS